MAANQTSTITPVEATAPTAGVPNTTQYSALESSDDPSDDASEGSSPGKSTDPHSKPCNLCSTPRNVLIRCQIDSTKKWVFVCTGKCWRGVSGGQMDGDGDHPDYTYGGTWKNKHVYVSAKMKGKAKEDGAGVSGSPRDRPIKKSSKGTGKYDRWLREVDFDDLDEEQDVDDVY